MTDIQMLSTPQSVSASAKCNSRLDWFLPSCASKRLSVINNYENWGDIQSGERSLFIKNVLAFYDEEIESALSSMKASKML